MLIERGKTRRDHSSRGASSWGGGIGDAFEAYCDRTPFPFCALENSKFALAQSCRINDRCAASRITIVRN